VSLEHKIVLYGLLGVLGLRLVGPGLAGVFKPDAGRTWLIGETVDARNHRRALNAMMAAMGAIALWACWDLERARLLVLGLGLILAALVGARVYSIVVDGVPGAWTFVYLIVETVMAAVFLIWPPPG